MTIQTQEPDMIQEAHLKQHIEALPFPSQEHFSENDRTAILQTIDLLNQGSLRVCEKINQQWVTHCWIKKSILLYFAIQENTIIQGAHTNYFDKVPSKYQHYTAADFQNDQIRVVPGAYARYGSYVGKQCVLMPSFINIGAYIDRGCMIDSMASIGSCAQIGRNVHISGGSGIGGVLEPLQENPTVIEDDCFIGARSEIVEGVIVEQEAVIAMGVFIGQSTKIFDRTQQKWLPEGRIPAGAVVVPGQRLDTEQEIGLSSAIIVKYTDAQTRKKVGINELLRA